MAKTNWQDPKTGEIISPQISGLQEAVGKLEESIGIGIVAETDILLSEIFISNDDRCRIYQAPEGKRNWILSPTPVIKKNGYIITDDFEIDYGGGAVIFTTPILETDTLTADATCTKKNENLAGEGRTTETVKANADNILALNANYQQEVLLTNLDEYIFGNQPVSNMEGNCHEYIKPCVPLNYAIKQIAMKGAR